MTGKEFRKWRRSLEISQQVVADYAECNKSTICRWEKEQIKIYPDLYSVRNRPPDKEAVFWNLRLLS